MVKKGSKYKKYSPEFKISVILDMREHNLSYHETARKYLQTKSQKEASNQLKTLHRWERIYLEEGEAGLYIEKRGRASNMGNPKIGRPRKKPFDKNVKGDLIKEIAQLQKEVEFLKAENEYLKKLDALVRAEEQKKSKKQK